jgi:rRNA small subunit aminocarboxypropyltransferase
MSPYAPPYPPTIVWRHRKENLKKCSLRGLEGRSDFLFLSYPNEELPNLDHYLLLTIEAPELSIEDCQAGLLLLDGTWRYAEKMASRLSHLPQEQRRSLPSWLTTAYPRRQEGCIDPGRGLASIEALYAAYLALGRPTDGLLDRYTWRDQFLLQFD